MTEKAKVTKITRMDKLDTYGNTSFIVEFDNGQKGFYTSKNPNQTKFIVGNVADYNIEEKQGSKGTYYKITVPQTEGKSFGGKPQVDPRFQFIGFSCAYAKDLVVAGKVSIQEMHVTSEAIFKTMIKLYNTIQ